MASICPLTQRPRPGVTLEETPICGIGGCPVGTTEQNCNGPLALDRVPPFSAGQTLPMGLFLNWASPRKPLSFSPGPSPPPQFHHFLKAVASEPQTDGFRGTYTQGSGLDLSPRGKATGQSPGGPHPSSLPPSHAGPSSDISSPPAAHWAPAPAHPLHSGVGSLSQTGSTLLPPLLNKPQDIHPFCFYPIHIPAPHPFLYICPKWSDISR